MKQKILAFSLALAMAFSLTACGDTGGTSSPSTGTASSGAASSGAASSGAAASGAASSGGAASGGTYTVGICQLVQHPALDAATQGFIDVLNEVLGDSVKIDSQNAANDAPACATICNGFVSSGYDLILANATPALEAAVAATSEIPILGTSVTDYGTALHMDDWTGASGINVSGTSDLAPLDGQAEMLHELFPDVKKVGILYCSGEANSAYQVSVITPYLEEYGYEVTAYTFADSNDVASVTTNACNENEVLYVPTDNTAASCAEAINNVALPAGIPIVAGEEGICKGCGVATLSIDYYELGRITGTMACEILTSGTNPGTMDVQFAPQFTKEYNPVNCEKLNITPPSDYVAIEG